jgi:very-short-patch-repair endonuclease
MNYYCSVCKKTITEKVYQYSMDKFGKALCYEHQNDVQTKYKSNHMSKRKQTPSSTPEAKKLGLALRKRGVPVELEKWDGFKHIDIAVVEAKVNIEVDGGHHNYSNKQALADLKRTFYSFCKGYLTLRIPNSLVKNEETLEETADYIVDFLNESIEQMDDDYDDDDY